MHARRLACFFLGMWLAGGLLMAWLAAQNVSQADGLLSRAAPEATLRLKPLGPDARLILRYQAAEQNRWYAQSWETAQIFFGAFFFLMMLFGSREDKFVLLGVLVMLALVLVQKLLITPELTALGRMLDFNPPDAAAPGRFQVVRTAYMGVEATKWAVALALTGRMVLSRKRSGRSRDARREIDRVDKANYRSVNR